MGGSECEERLRSKSVYFLRSRYPKARIIHELKLGDEVRIDLAAVSENHIALLEIKSEKDNFKRLGAQMARAKEVGQSQYIVLAKPHDPRFRAWYHMNQYDAGHLNATLSEACKRHKRWLPDALRGHENQAVFHQSTVLCEEEDGRLMGMGFTQNSLNNWNHINPRILLSMMWAEELRQIGADHMIKCAGSMWGNIPLLMEGMTGGQIRKAVCKALRSRFFARADDPVIEDRFAAPRQEPPPL